MTRSELNSALLAAHERGDGRQLAELYTLAGDQADNVDEACFFWTNAYVFALETGHPDINLIRHKLVQHAREL